MHYNVNCKNIACTFRLQLQANESKCLQRGYVRLTIALLGLRKQSFSRRGDSVQVLKILVDKADFYPRYVLTCVHHATLNVLSNHRSQISGNTPCLGNASPSPEAKLLGCSQRRLGRLGCICCGCRKPRWEKSD